MPRPVSWLPRLHVIRRTITTSVRSHYDRRELETLFELQPRPAKSHRPCLGVSPSLRGVPRTAPNRFARIALVGNQAS